MRAVKVFILIFTSLQLQAFELESKPFWHEPKNLAKLENREILVSVTNSEGRSFFKGVGYVRSTLEDGFRFAQDFKVLEKVQGQFSQVEFDHASRVLTVKIHLPWRKEKVRVHLTPEKGKERSVLWFEVIEGFGQGIEGGLVFQDLKRQDPMLEVSIQAVTAENKKFSWFTNLGIEAILRHVANSMRSQLEQDVQALPKK